MIGALKFLFSHFFTSFRQSNFRSDVSVSIRGIGMNGHHRSLKRHSVFLCPVHDPMAASVICFDGVLGQIRLPW